MKMPWEDNINWNNTATTIVKGEPMSNRDCETCVHARLHDGENDNRCSAWSCEYINRDEAIEAWEILKAMRETKGIVTTGTIGDGRNIPTYWTTSASTKGE